MGDPALGAGAAGAAWGAAPGEMLRCPLGRCWSVPCGRAGLSLCPPQAGFFKRTRPPSEEDTQELTPSQAQQPEGAQG